MNKDFIDIIFSYSTFIKSNANHLRGKIINSCFLPNIIKINYIFILWIIFIINYQKHVFFHVFLSAISINKFLLDGFPTERVNRKSMFKGSKIGDSASPDKSKHIKLPDLKPMTIRKYLK